MSSVLGTDIIVHGDDGIIAAVEVKNRKDLTADVAVTLRRNMLAHRVLPPVRFFLLVSQDRAFLWTEKDRDDLDAVPSFEVPMQEIVRRYLPEQGARWRLRGAELELLVLLWLGSLVGGHGQIEGPESPLAASGFIDALRGATVTRAVA